MTVTVHKAKTQLSKLIEKVLRGEEVIIARRDKPVVRLEPVRQGGGQSGFGSMKDLIEYMAPDFDEPLEDFKDYMETAVEERARSKWTRSK